MASGDFPEWRTPETLRATTWKTGRVDTLPEANGVWYIVVDDRKPFQRDTLVSLVVRLYPMMSLVMQPLEWSATTVGKVVLAPLEPPVRYSESTDLIERAVELVRIDTSGHLIAYPTLVMDGAAGSRLGASIVSTDLAGSKWYGSVSGAVQLNRDWYAGMNTLSPPFGEVGMRFRGRLAAAFLEDASVWVPGAYPLDESNTPINVGMRRGVVSAGLSIPLGWMGGIEPSWTGVARQVVAPASPSGIGAEWREIPWFERGDRGMRGNEISHDLSLNWSRGSKDYEGIPTEGGRRSMSLTRVISQGGGDAVKFSMEATGFFLLGDEKYVYRKEDVEPYLNLSPQTIVRMLDPTTLRRRLTQRRVLAFKVRAERLWEDEDGTPASFFHFPSLGGDAPARAYGGSRLTDRAVAGGALEYRWPIWKYIDGAMFTELAYASRELWKPEPDFIAPGVGIALRVRTRSQFLFRLQATTGRDGTRFLATVSPEF